MKSKSSKRKSARTARAVQAKSGNCECGCGEEVSPGRRFKPGHDMRVRPNSKWRTEHPELFKS